MKSIVLQDSKKLIKSNRLNFLYTTVLVWMILFIFNIIFWLTISANKIEEDAASRIWIYFYIQEDENNKDEIYTRIIWIKDALNKEWIKVRFSSKDEAFSYLESKIPELTNNFDRFGIENPLPSTLYVMFSSKKEYEKMKEIIIANKDIIMNAKNIDQWATLTQQENRSLRILKILDIIKIILYATSIIIAVTIVTFMQHLLTTFFHSFSKEVEIKKLLWATRWQANEWFLLVLKVMMILWIAIGSTLAFIAFTVLDKYLWGIWIALWLKHTAFRSILPWTAFCLIWILLWYLRLDILESKI